MIAAAEGRQRHDLTRDAVLLSWLSNIHRHGMDRYDKNGNRHDGPHPKAWTANEFLPPEFRLAERDAPKIEGSIHCLKVFVPAGAEPVKLDRSTFTVLDDD